MAHTCEDFSNTIESLIQHPTLQEARRLYAASAVYSLSFVQHVAKQEQPQMVREVAGTNRYALNKPYRSQVNGLIQASLDDINELPMALSLTNQALACEDEARQQEYATHLGTLHFALDRPLTTQTAPIETLTVESVGISSAIAAEVDIKLSITLHDELIHLARIGVLHPVQL